MLTSVSKAFNRLTNRRTRTLIITGLLVLSVGFSMVRPQASVWACPITGSCPCPGC